MLDEGSLAYPYGVLAASILYHFGNDTTTEKASGKYVRQNQDQCDVCDCDQQKSALSHSLDTGECMANIRFLKQLM